MSDAGGWPRGTGAVGGRFQPTHHDAAPHPAPRTVRAAGVGAGIPQDFVMRNTTKFADPMLAFSDAGGQLGEGGRGPPARRAGPAEGHACKQLCPATLPAMRSQRGTSPAAVPGERQAVGV